MVFKELQEDELALASEVMGNFKHLNYGNDLLPVNADGQGVDNLIDLGSQDYKFKNIHVHNLNNADVENDKKLYWNTGLITITSQTIHAGNVYYARWPENDLFFYDTSLEVLSNEEPTKYIADGFVWEDLNDTHGVIDLYAQPSYPSYLNDLKLERIENNSKHYIGIRINMNGSESLGSSHLSSSAVITYHKYFQFLIYKIRD